MKSSLVLIISLIICIEFSGCKKENSDIHDTADYDTVYPGGYYPSFPNTWWKYIVNDSEISIIEVSESYVLHSYKNAQYDTSSYSEPKYVPFVNSQPIYGYMKLQQIIPPYGKHQTLWPILSEEIGFKFDRYWSDKRYGDFAEHVEVVNKIFNGSDSLLKLEGHWVYGPLVNNKSYQVFTKGIGLTSGIIVDTVNNDTITKKILIDYFIGN
nr:hypothetical protein [Bacteroidota bacterium]